ncbi:MAG: hypothetical protein K9N51_05715 [Candidatus Pacebacteria bacterium]|nr:hypothetical protein [Candidatus Paceibacterota bacterium]
MLETAITLPLFLGLLCFCLDAPRILGIRQRMAGASRLVAELRARNNGDFGVNEKKLRGALNTLYLDGLWGIKDDPEIVQDNKPTHLKKAYTALTSLLFAPPEPWDAVMKFIGDVLTGGAWPEYVAHVFEGDVLYGAACQMRVKTILPEEAYRTWLGSENAGDEWAASPSPCYMPNLEAWQHRTTPIGNLGSGIEKAKDALGL